MRNCASRWCAAATAAWLTASGAAWAQSPKARFDAATAREDQVRLALGAAARDAAPPEVLKEVTQVAVAYELIVRRYPTTGYADNALWQGAALAAASFDTFGRQADRDRALRLYRWLVTEYPGSPYLKRARGEVKRLADTGAATTHADSPVPAVLAPPAAPAPATASGAVPVERAMLTAIQRTVLPDAVRVTVELDREVAYHEERLAGPSRVFFDLKGVQASPALADKVLTYSGDIVNTIRVGRHPDSTVRVVLDLDDVSKYSVFTLYNPFRLVIDCQRTVRRTVAQPSVVAPVSAEPLPPVESSPIIAGPSVPSIGVPPPTVAPPAANAAGGFSLSRQLGLGVSRVVIDPGHGGRDPGAQGKGLNEADLVLDVALRLEQLLRVEPGLDVTLTRRTDVYVPLEERTAIATSQNADLFLSIHANASRNEAARGIETYFLSFASSPDAEQVAARENSASGREMHHLPDIIKAITLNNKLDESKDLAGMVQESLTIGLRKSNKDLRNLGVKKAPFVVLIGAAMPSVLTEISFVTNKQELQLLKTAAYKQKIADALCAAVLRYRRSLKNGTAVASQ